MKYKKVLLILVIIFACGMIFYLFFVPKIKLNGKSVVTIEYNKKYVEKNATCNYLGKNLSDKIKISGSVNTKKIGKYKIKYSLKYGIFKVGKTRLIKVVDKTKPLITLKGEKSVNICPGTKYEEDGYTAYDEYDKDLTKNVKIENKDNYVVYTVSDKSNNTYTIKRKITELDDTKPEIKLNGNENMTIIVNREYNEPGYTAIDNCSGDLKESVKVTGSVDISKEGEYQITYTVSDKAGNETSVKRNVTVTKNYPKVGANLSCGEPGVIYLTLDDGPNNSTTTTVLNILKKYDVKATFFVTNTNGGSDSQIKREYDEGHVVAIHSATHNYSQIYKSSEAFWNDVKIVSDRIERITGEKSYLLRFPGGSSNTVSRRYKSGIMTQLAYETGEKGYSYFDWNLMSGDAEVSMKGNNDAQYNLVVRNLSKSRGNVVLMHDIQTTTSSNVLERIIQYGLNNGYKFKTLDSTVICHQKVNN